MIVLQRPIESAREAVYTLFVVIRAILPIEFIYFYLLGLQSIL